MTEFEKMIRNELNQPGMTSEKLRGELNRIALDVAKEKTAALDKKACEKFIDSTWGIFCDHYDSDSLTLEDVGRLAMVLTADKNPTWSIDSLKHYSTAVSKWAEAISSFKPISKRGYDDSLGIIGELDLKNMDRALENMYNKLQDFVRKL